MTDQIISDKDKVKLDTFFTFLFGEEDGFICIALLPPGLKQKMHREFFKYPEELEKMIGYVSHNAFHTNVYFCPQVYDSKNAHKGHVKATPNVWADLDSCHPSKMLVEPSISIESSPGRFHAYWALSDDSQPDDVEDLAYRIAYRHADEGADRSGWDLSQLLRVPFTYNFKYPGTDGGFPPTVKINSAKKITYSMKDFAEYPLRPEYTKIDTKMPEIIGIEADAQELLFSKRSQLNPLTIYMFETVPDEKKWSETLWRFLQMLFEAGYSREEVFVIAQEAKCNKFARDGRPREQLWRDVCRAEMRALKNKELMLTRPEEFRPLLTQDEQELVEKLDDTFVERYIKWASSLGDAAPQYHQAGAFVILSSLCVAGVNLPTSFGTIYPIMWFMLLADTTLTRKTTSMDIAMDLLEEVDPETIMATDGSLEGLLTSLTTRANKPSIFLRDEFSGLLEQMTKKEYMAGMPEMLTKLYDGKMQKRVLRKEVVEVRDPRLIFYAGGIKNKITSLLTYEHVSSGFLPRFVLITAESDITKIRPIGPPTTQTYDERNEILSEMEEIYAKYNRKKIMHNARLNVSGEMPFIISATMTEDAWVRYAEVEAEMLTRGMESHMPDVLTPVGDRLSKSILKAAVLIAASRHTDMEDDTLVIELEDILRALRYGQQWLEHALEVMNNVGKGTAEKQLDTIYNAIKHAPGISRTSLMQHYKLTSRDAQQIFMTLEERGMIIQAINGRAKTYTITAAK